MPPITQPMDGKLPRVVIGDRHGRSCHARFAERLRGVAMAAGLPTSRNLPYAGGHTLDRHARPIANIHALQIEIDRSLYLAPDLRTLGPGLSATTALVGRFASAMLDELGPALNIQDALAAE
jgi:N-formylglutamate amidohydrolase